MNKNIGLNISIAVIAFASTAFAADKNKEEANIGLFSSVAEVEEIGADSLKAVFSVSSSGGLAAMFSGRFNGPTRMKFNSILQPEEYRIVVWNPEDRSANIVITKESTSSIRDFIVVARNSTAGSLQFAFFADEFVDGLSESRLKQETDNEWNVSFAVEVPVFGLDVNSGELIRSEKYLRLPTCNITVSKSRIQWRGVSKDPPPGEE